MKGFFSLPNVPGSIIRGIVGITALTILTSGCAGATKLAHTSKGSVYLEEVTDWSFEASHPAVIDQMTITKIVRGLYSNDGQGGSSRMSAGGSKPMRIFNDEDAEFLSPLLAQGLSKAKPEQLVGFRVSSSAGSGVEPTTGSIYVKNGSIYVTIGKGAKPTGFMPDSAGRIEPAQAFAAGGAIGAMTMVIDYHALAKAPMPAAMPIAKSAQLIPVPPVTAAIPMKALPVSDSGGQVPGQNDPMYGELEKAKEALAKKNTEINMLRKESEWMKRELRERDEEMKALRSTKVSAKPSPKKKPVEATQIR